MKTPIFEGMASAIITPLNEKGIDYELFAKLVEWQIAEGIDGLVVCGTTGEGATLTDEEHKSAIEFMVKQVAGRVPVIAGTGSNDTAYAVELTKHACQICVDGVLTVTPYYNKATQKGLFKSFTQIADASSVPVILYNVPSRTGVNIAPKTVLELSKHPNINAIKEASGDISQIAEIAHLCGDNINIYSGNDDQVVPIMSLGGKGCISVLSNLLPKETSKMCRLFREGDVKAAARLQLKYIPLINALFSEVNPIPVKAAMAKMGFCEDYLRLPLTPMEDATRENLYLQMKNAGINI